MPCRSTPQKNKILLEKVPFFIQVTGLKKNKGTRSCPRIWMHALICQVSKLIIKRSRNNEASVVRKLEKKIKILIQRHGRIWWRGWIPYCAFSSNGADGSGGYGFFEQGDDGSVGAQIAHVLGFFLRMAQQQSQILLNGRILHRTDPAADCVPCPRRAISGVKFCPVVAAAGVAICCGREEGRKKVYRLLRGKIMNPFFNWWQWFVANCLI